MDIKCPHCGTEYEIENEDFGRFVKCEICGKGFVAGAFAATETSEKKNPPHAAPDENKSFWRKIYEWNIAMSPKTAKMLASSPWTIQFSTVYLLVFMLVFIGGDLLTSKPPSPFIRALVLSGITVPIEITLVRFNFLRWLHILWGAFNLVLLVRICNHFGSRDFGWLWPLHVSFVAVAILLLMKNTGQWYVNGPKVNCSADFSSYYRMAGIAAVLAIIAGIVLYVGYDSARKQIRSSRSTVFPYDASMSPSSYSPSYKASADQMAQGALENVRRRYNAKLSRYGLAESYFDETNGICDLMLLDVSSWTKYQIVYYRSTGQIEWPRLMPKNVAEDLMEDRLIIHTYETSLGIGEGKSGCSSSLK